MDSRIVSQFSRFVVVGFMNTAIDFTVLNILSFVTGIYAGAWLIVLNSTAFLAATTNSYFMNKYWTFGVRDGAQTSEVSKFLSVSLVGLVINSSIVYGITTFLVSPLPQITLVLWENLAKATATGISLFWNFIGYKFLVFNKQS